jgi:hypothetical protein
MNLKANRLLSIFAFQWIFCRTLSDGVWIHQSAFVAQNGADLLYTSKRKSAHLCSRENLCSRSEWQGVGTFRAVTRKRFAISSLSNLRCHEDSQDAENLHKLPHGEVVKPTNSSAAYKTEASFSRTIQDILSIASDNRLSEIDRIQLIRSALPAPIFPYETEPGMMGETRVAKSFGHLNDLLFLDSWAEHSDKLGPYKLYRGVPDSSMELLTSLQRLVEPTNHIKSSKAKEMGATSDVPTHLSTAAMKRIEQVRLVLHPLATAPYHGCVQGMIESFRKYSYGTARIGNDASLLEWMALAQVVAALRGASDLCAVADSAADRAEQKWLMNQFRSVNW